MTNSDNMARLTLCFSTIWDVFTPSLDPMLGFWRHFLKHPLKLLHAVCVSGNITFLVLLGHLNISSLVACFLHDLPTGVHMLLDFLRKHQKIKGRSTPKPFKTKKSDNFIVARRNNTEQREKDVHQKDGKNKETSLR